MVYDFLVKEFTLMQNLDKALIQEIGGWMLTIAVILVQTRRAMSNLELEKWTGLTDKTLARYLDKLETKGRILRTSAGWMLSQGFQMELFDTLKVLADMRPNSESEKFRLESEILRLNEPLAVVVESKLNVPTTTTTTTTTESEILRLKNITALRELGIVGSRPNKVAALEWVTPEYINAHVAAARKNTGIDNPEGFALTQMEYQAPIPFSQEKRNASIKTLNSYDARVQALRNRAQEDNEEE
jgi:hypothetical protein